MGRPTQHNEGEMCEECGVRPKGRAGYYTTEDGERHPRFRGRCNQCHRARKVPWLRYRKDECEGCGYRPYFIGSLDVHHRDGDKNNNEPDNLETLCATCHREIHAILHDVDGDIEKADSIFMKVMNAIKG